MNAMSTCVELAALELAAELEHVGEQVGVAVARAQARRSGLAGQPLGLGEATGEQRLDRGPQRRVPLEGGEAQLVGEPRVAGDLLAAGGHVAELEEVGDPPVARLQLGVALAGLARRRDHVCRGRKPLLDAVRAPERDVAGVEREASALGSPAARAVATASALSASERVRSGA